MTERRREDDATVAVLIAKFDSFDGYVREKLEAIDRQFDRGSDRMGRIEQSVFGNGAPGLDEQVRAIQANCEARHKAAEKRESEELWWTRTKVGATVALFVGLVVEVAAGVFVLMWRS